MFVPTESDKIVAQAVEAVPQEIIDKLVAATMLYGPFESEDHVCDVLLDLVNVGFGGAITTKVEKIILATLKR